MSTDNIEQQDILRWYTAARRLQRLVGKAPGGGYYPGGPYPITAIFGAGVVLLVLTLTKGVIWSTGDWLTDSVLIPGVSALVVLFALKKVKPGGRNPLSAAWAVCGAVTSPSYGRYRGRALRNARSHRVRHRINADLAGVFIAETASAGSSKTTTVAVPTPDVSKQAVELSAQRTSKQDVPDDAAATTKKHRSWRELKVRPALKEAASSSSSRRDSQPKNSAISGPTATAAEAPVAALSSIQRRLSGAGERRAS